jgi:hypothetical protein
MKGLSIDKNKEILTKLINKIILKRYPELTLDDISPFAFRGYTIFEVMFLTSEILPSKVQNKILNDIDDLFIAAGLNDDENGSPNANSIGVYFKAPGEDEFTFTNTLY